MVVKGWLNSELLLEKMYINTVDIVSAASAASL